jgi:DNA recombination protein RmuC
MEILFLISGLILGFIIAYLFLKNKAAATGDTSVFDAKLIELEKQKLVISTNFENAQKEITRLTEELRLAREQFHAELADEREKNNSSINTEREKANSEINLIRKELNEANITIAKAREAFKAQEEKYVTLKSELEGVHKKYTSEFELIANKILEEKSVKFTEQNKSNLDIILNPLKENIKAFEEKVEKAYKAESDERIVLKTEIKNLIDLNKQVSEEANNLAKALKGDNKMQGNWGEHILENIFERSGLVKDQEYKKEFSATDEEGGRNRPDFVVLLPDNKHIIVDSKVSLVAYEKCVNATEIPEREQFIKEHILSIRTHIKGLSERSYQSISALNSPDFVLLFIPIESSFSIAVQADLELFNFAWDRKIVIVSPSTLLATLRTIASVWKQERQTKNAIEIAKQSGALYDKFVGFLEDMDKIGKNIEASRSVYESAMNKLYKGTGNLVKRAQDIEKLGANTTKKISPKFTGSDEPSQLTEEPTA